MDGDANYGRFKVLNYQDFRLMANDQSLSKYEKIGFPDNYRQGKEESIFRDIIQKLGLNDVQNKVTILDIGPGCTDLPLMMMEFCRRNDFPLLLVDSEEMLNILPKDENVLTFPGCFPSDFSSLINDYKQKVDYIICYSVLHCVFYESCIYKFIDSAVTLLKPGGKLLLGDIPNISKRTRFFSTPTGVKFHQKFTNSNSLPDINHFELKPAMLDDSVIFSILQRYRNLGFETFVMAQPVDLPMSNRREDILICRT